MYKYLNVLISYLILFFFVSLFIIGLMVCVMVPAYMMARFAYEFVYNQH